MQAEARPATAEEQAALARWSGWGAVPFVFDPQAASYDKFQWAREELRGVLSAAEYAAAERTTLNAHYTDAAYVRSIWDAVTDLGFTEGTVLEPGCGSGNFIALAPEGARMVGVELDPTTASVAAALYPNAEVRAESFADSRFPEGAFDLVVGNVPFGDIALHDPRHNRASHRIHNHFVIKGLHLTRPGGLVAVITSRYTMDAANPAARREIAGLADLVGAVRLPTGAHRRAAGTDVVTDVLLFRRREAGAEPRGQDFERALPQPFGDATLNVNEYFVAHPEHVLGELSVTQADRGRTELQVTGDRAAGQALSAALQTIVALAKERGLGLASRGAEAAIEPSVARIGPATQRPDGFLEAHPDGTFTELQDGRRAPYKVPSTQALELRALLGMRDAAVELLEREARSNDDTTPLDALRVQLNERYDAYARAYGPINRFSERRTGRVDPSTGEEKLARVRPGQGGFYDDPYAMVVYALEHFDDSTQTATKATIFRERVVARRVPRLGADTPEDALAICLDTHGEVRLDDIARLLGTDSQDARSRLGTLVFDEPETDRLVPAAEYLSGNVRVKLSHAQQAMAEDGRYAPNVRALTEVLPRDLGPEDIRATLGAAWIAPEYVQQFLREILEDPSVLVENPGGAIWAVRGQSRTVMASTRWGTEKCSAIELAHQLLEQRPIRVYDTDDKGEQRPNATATVAAQEKATELAERFAEWVWEVPQRAAALTRVYNDRFNALRPRTYDGSHLTLPGLALSFKPRPHQLDAVARIIAEPAVGLYHEVGAGKTAEMVMGAMELRRLGMVQKPVVVVPNHMLDQFSREWLQIYPQARLLAASNKDLERDKRRLFVARCATGDWDAVVMTRSAFERIPMSRDAQQKYLESEVDAITTMIAKSKGGAGLTTKRLQGMKVRTEERLKKKLDSDKDLGLSFEQLGVDYLFVDEAHAYKNLRTTSNIPGMSVEGSQRAQDLHMKLEYLRSKNPRVATLATATPIANSMGEVYTMQRYLRPDLLASAGISDHDSWAATFGKTVTAIEVAPDGSGMRMQTRFASFHNVPELLQQWQVAGDIKTAEDLKLPVPALVPRASDGQRAPETVIVPPSEALKTLVADLALRADRVRSRLVKPHEDNMLSISSDGRAAALDLRLVGDETSSPQKVDIAAARIAAIYRENQARTFLGHDRQPHHRPGALQIVFSDLGTPKADGWSVYEELRQKLVSAGLPRESVRFMHEAANDREKAALFAACRDGRVAVLIGSTERMGVGTNVQLRAVALHHLDCPWRPADIAQREGRILRQGNANEAVQILRYVTEGSFDAYLWQTVTRKAQFIGQVMRGRMDVREIEDIGEAALSYNEVKALATGNPLLLEHAKAQAEVQRLERLERAHQRNQGLLRVKIVDEGAYVKRLEERIQLADAAITRLLPLGGRPRNLSVGGTPFEKPGPATAAVRQRLMAILDDPASRGRTHRIGEVLGVAMLARRDTVYDRVTLSLEGVPWSEIELSRDEAATCAPFTRLDTKLEQMPNARALADLQILQLRKDAARARDELGKPFRHGDKLREERARLTRLDTEMHQHAADQAAARAVAAQAADPAAADGERDEVAAKHASGLEKLQRWNDLVSQEVQAVQTRAAALEQRLLARARQLDEVYSRLSSTSLGPRGVLGLLRGRAQHEANQARCSHHLDQVGSTQARVAKQLAMVKEYLHPAVPGYGSPASRAASNRVGRKHADLLREVTDFAAWRRAEESRERSRSTTTRTSEGIDRAR